MLQAKNGKSSKKSAADSAMLANSEAILAGIMAEVEGRAPAKSAAEVAAQSVTMPSSSASAPKNGASAARKRTSPAQIATPASDMVPTEITAAVKASPVKPATPEAAGMSVPSAAKSRAVRAAPAIADEFVPPADYIKPAAPELTPAQAKELVRKEQMAKALEAEERKKLQIERKVQKAQKVSLFFHMGISLRFCSDST